MSAASSIEAGAGTGKTTRVVRLLLQSLLATGTEPSRLLALTFTVRAANEMRDRLGTWLARLVAGEPVGELHGGLELFGDPATARGRGLRALAELDRIEIGTIHSFAAHLLRQYPLEGGVSPAFEEDDGTRAAAIFRDLWPRWLEGRLADLTALEFLQSLLGRLELTHLRRFAEALCEDGAPLELAEDRGRAEAWRARLAEAAARAEALLRAHAGEARVTALRAMRALEYMRRLFGAGEATSELARQVSLLTPPAPTVAGWTGGEQETYRQLRELARAVVDVDDRQMAALLAWLQPFVAQFRREYARRGHVSFQGLLVRARGVLRDHPDVRDRLKQRFRLIVVDEFQDTDPLQGEILLYLAERQGACETDWRRIEVEPGKLVIVGDPKQSIYLFRGADLEVYQEIVGRLPGEVERLTVNYRARPELVAFVNVVGRRTIQAPAYVPLDPSPERGPGGTVEMMLFRGLGAGEARESEAEAIAEWVAAGVAAGRFATGDVALLLRALGEAHHYTDAFRRRGIDFAIEGEKHFYAAQEVLDLLNLLGAIADPTNELAVVGVLRSPLGAVRDRDLLHLRDADALCPLDADRVPHGLPDVRRLYQTIAQLHARAWRVPVGDLLAEVLERFPLAEIARATFRGEQAVANIDKLVEALTAEGTTLAAALAEYRRRFGEREEEGEAPLADEQLDAVRILSIHKAKGLEFPVVVVPDLHRGPGDAAEGPILREWLTGVVGFRCGRLRNRDRVAAEERYRRIRKEETRRLLYVALTRAKDRLLLTGGKSASDTLLAMIVAALREEGLVLGEEAEQTLRGDGFEVSVRLCDQIEPAWGPPPVPAPAPAPDYAAERAAWVEREAAARRLQAALLLRRPSSGTEPDLERTYRLEREDGEADPLTVGSRCHDLLAEMDLAHPERVAAAGEAGTILRSFFASEVFREIQTADEVHREVPFVITLDGEVWSGQIDLLYRRGERWIVADYKSDRDERPERHRLQADVYTRAAQRALHLAAPPEFRLIYLRTGRAIRL